jgi:hypothetical protein
MSGWPSCPPTTDEPNGPSARQRRLSPRLNARRSRFFRVGDTVRVIATVRPRSYADKLGTIVAAQYDELAVIFGSEMSHAAATWFKGAELLHVKVGQTPHSIAKGSATGHRALTPHHAPTTDVLR